MKWYWWVLIVIFVYGFLTKVYTLDEFMDNPLDNFMDSAEELLNLGTSKLGADEVDGKTNYGKPDCLINEDCNSIEECKDNLCVCEDGECFK